MSEVYLAHNLSQNSANTCVIKILILPWPLPSRAKQWRDGDWMCTNCDNHNYASRLQCNRLVILNLLVILGFFLTYQKKEFILGFWLADVATYDVQYLHLISVG